MALATSPCCRIIITEHFINCTVSFNIYNGLVSLARCRPITRLSFSLDLSPCRPCTVCRPWRRSLSRTEPIVPIKGPHSDVLPHCGILFQSKSLFFLA